MIERRGLWWWVKWYFATTWIMMWGLCLVCLGCSVLLQKWPDLVTPRWHGLVFWSSIVPAAWAFVVSCSNFPRISDIEKADNLELFLFPSAVCAGVLTWKWESTWTGIFVGPLAAAHLSLVHVKRKGRAPIWATAACCLASAAVYFIPWHAPQRFLLAVVLCGLVIIIDGGIAFASSLLGLGNKSRGRQCGQEAGQPAALNRRAS